MRFIPDDLPTIPAGTEYADLPDDLERQCCPGKSCGPTTVSKQLSAVVVDGRAELRYSYNRGNGDPFYGPYGTVDELIAAVNDTRRWPGGWVATDAGEALYCAVRFVEDAHLDGQTRSLHADYPLVDAYRDATVAESDTEFVVTPPQSWMGAVVIDKVTGSVSFRDQDQPTTGLVD